MNTNRIFIGNIMFDKELFLAEVILLKCDNEIYVALDDIHTIMDIYRINNNNNKDKMVVFSTTKSFSYWVDEQSLIPYYKKQNHKTLARIKAEVMINEQLPRSIDH